MSFQGINFAKQRLVPSDDGRLYQNIFNDGALFGCALSYSGSILTLASGHLMIGGRQIEIDAAEEMNVNQAISGYAQLVIIIDLTKTATTTTFNQVAAEIRYSSTEDGFATLIQEDINGFGSRYEAQLALLSLGTGGITGILQDMPQAAFKGAPSGTGLNLTVVGNTVKPASPAENTIWVNTDTAIDKYAFSAAEPTNPVEGMVWFETGVDSPAPINVGKLNTVMLYPTGCKQYISGAWIDKTAKTYIGGKWLDWYVYLLKLDWQNEILGGWNEYGNYGSATFGDKGLVLTHNNGQGKLVVSKNQIDVSKYKKLYFDVNVTDAPTWAEGLTVGIGLTNQWDGNYHASINSHETGTYTLEVDISSVDSGYIKINNAGAATTVANIYMA